MSVVDDERLATVASPASLDQLWIKLVVDQMLLSSDSLFQLSSETIDASLQAFDLTILLAWCCFSAGVLCTKAIDVASILAMDQVEKILVIEALALAGLVADDSIVVQVDVHILATCVLKNVDGFCAATLFCFTHNCVDPFVVLLKCYCMLVCSKAQLKMDKASCVGQALEARSLWVVMICSLCRMQVCFADAGFSLITHLLCGLDGVRTVACQAIDAALQASHHVDCCF